jgi:hydrogenase nickel incorporation protein HypB
MFHSANVAIVTKSDLAAAAGFNREQTLANLKRVSHHAQIFELSAKIGNGMQAWMDYLVKKRATQTDSNRR